MTWISTFFEKIGAGEAWKIYENSPERPPDGFDPDASAADYLSSRAQIYKASDEYKSSMKEARIVGLKEYKRQLNEYLSVGLTGEEAARLDPGEFLDRIKEKVQADIDAAKIGKASEWEGRYKNIEKEFNAFKLTHENLVKDWEERFAQKENEIAAKYSEIKKAALFADTFNKIDFGKDEAHRENAKIIIQSVMKERGWNYDDTGRLYRGENDVVTNDDGHTIIKNIEEGIKTIAAARKLFPQANPAQNPRNPGQYSPTGDPAADALVQKQLAQLQKVDALK